MQALNPKKLVTVIGAGVVLLLFSSPAVRARENDDVAVHQDQAAHDTQLEWMPLLQTRNREENREALREHLSGEVVVPYPYYWDSPWWWEPAWYDPYGYRGLYRPTVHVMRSEMIPIQLDIRPRRTQVSIDGNSVGEVRDFDAAHPLMLKPGLHMVQLSETGYETLQIRVDTNAVGNTVLRYHLTKGTGADPRSNLG